MGHVLNYLITAETRKAHRARWFVWGWDCDGSREKLPHNAKMRGTWGWDVECSCGWKSRTGGATRGSVENELLDHRYEAQANATDNPRYCPSCRIGGNDDSRLGRDVVHNVEGAGPDGLLADVCESKGHVFPIENEED